MALTVWSSGGFGSEKWRGDLARWRKYFHPTAGYLQGDAAIKHPDGAYTFHGRESGVPRALRLAVSVDGATFHAVVSRVNRLGRGHQRRRQPHRH